MGKAGSGYCSERGLDARLLRTPRHLEERGCGYCLRLPMEAGLPAVEQLRRSGVPFRGVYVMLADGSAEEVSL